MTTELIRMRNWQKARLIGFTINRDTLGQAEQQRVQAILDLRNALLTDWDYNTEVLIGHSLPPFKCHSCGKRGNVPHNIDGHNYCAKHYKEFTNGN